MMHRLQATSVSEADVIRRLYRPVVADWVEITPVFFDNVNPRVRLTGDHWLLAQGHHKNLIVGLPFHRCELLQMLN